MNKQNKKMYLGVLLGALIVAGVLFVLKDRIAGLSSKAGYSGAVAAVRPSTGENKQQLKAVGDVDTKLIGNPTFPTGTPGVWQEIGRLSNQIEFNSKMIFISPSTGFLLGENGLYKTIDSGRTWNTVLVPYGGTYMVGLARDNGVWYVTGYNNIVGEETGVVWISRDNWATWESRYEINPRGRLYGLNFLNNIGMVNAGSDPITGYGLMMHGVNGALSSNDWFDSIVSGSEGWFGDQISVLPGVRADITGINSCTSGNAFEWKCSNSADPLADFSVKYLTKDIGYNGGGIISPESKGWVHKTTDGGITWSGRLVETPWPVRLVFNQGDIIYAAGGDAQFSNVGGVVWSLDGGSTWENSLQVRGEIRACDVVNVRKIPTIRCATTNRNPDGVTFTTIIYELSVQI